jgi:hypothetical protein
MTPANPAHAPDVALVVGHSRDSQGAVAIDGTTEWIWNREHAARIASAPPHPPQHPTLSAQGVRLPQEAK